ncbi:MAG: hypothetical protein CMI95_02880 [Pelagibacteraceae bacterium]|nr:hypothetical protein [Pelagibacteraceae bacterium]|tara:strand:+ start:16470 stop:17333 length:864 start_codon:yes stop_codon:yes gene_type:complete
MIDNKIFWIASYLKSGNTWVRSFLSSYLFTKDGSFDFHTLKKIQQFESFNFFSKYLNKDRVKSHPSDISKYWLEAQKNLKIQNGNTAFLKTHNFCGILNENHFTNSKLTRGFIYVVRDPREVVVSYSNFTNQNIEKSIDIILKGSLNNPIFTELKDDAYPVFLCNWGINYMSWKSFKKVPGIIIKYEDLKEKTDESFYKIINFLEKLGLTKYDKIKFSNSMKNTSFERLKKLEENYGFEEFKNSNEKMFFNKAKINSWKDILTSNQIKEIEKKYYYEMSELGYIKNS